MMTTNEIIEMARQAAAVHGHTFKEIPSPETVEFITSFYKLVAAKEREACALICEPKTSRPCDCECCDCGNSTSARMVAEWDESANIAKAIRARAQADGGEA
jgi:hypothetical protein